MADQSEPSGREPRDTGLRTLLTWTFIALIVTLVMAFVAVTLAIHFFDRP